MSLKKTKLFKTKLFFEKNKFQSHDMISLYLPAIGWLVRKGGVKGEGWRLLERRGGGWMRWMKSERWPTKRLRRRRPEEVKEGKGMKAEKEVKTVKSACKLGRRRRLRLKPEEGGGRGELLPGQLLAQN